MRSAGHDRHGLAAIWLAILIVLPTAPTSAKDARLFVSNEYFTFGSADYFTVDVALTDVDQDGDQDAVMVNGRHWARQDLVLVNNGAGRFLVARRLGDALTTGYRPAISDLDRDGRPDIVVARDRTRSRIFLNSGNGGFRDAGAVGPAGPTRAVAAADIDRDGATDLVFSLRGKNNQIVFGPDFARVVDLPPAEQSVRLVAADLNGDSFPDLVFANLGAEGSLIQFNDGNGGFSRSIRLDAEPRPSVDVAIGDIDGDGLPDAVFASIGANAIFFNDGEHEFSRSIPFGDGAKRSYGIALADFDGDDRLDIAIANAGSTNAVFFNRADGLLHQDLPDDPGALSYGVSSADLDGNGYPDLVFANSGSMSRVYLNVVASEVATALTR